MQAGSDPKPGLVLRNTLILVLAQLAGAPLSIASNAVMGRYLGAEAFGYAYLAWTLTLFGFMLVDWGHSGVLPAIVARDRSRAGEVLGTSIVWKLGSSIVVCSVLAAACWVLGYSAAFQGVLALVAVQCLLASLTSACQDVGRGFERTDLAAYGQFGQQALTAAIVIPAVLLGGKLNAVLAAQGCAAAVVLLFVWHSLQKLGVRPLKVRRDALRALFGQGSSFMLFSFAMTLQSNVDAIMLSKFSPPEVVGWQAAARRLSGVLVMPAAALIAALYPTLSRLHLQDPAAYLSTTRSALRGTILLAVPLALCCGIYRRVGVQIFDERTFGPAEANLVILAVLLLLVYVTMPLGSAIMAAGRQRAWAIAQSACVAVSLALDPLLIPWFQRTRGNGGLGVCVAGVASEVLMVTAAFVLAPAGVVDRSLWLAIAKAFLAGGCMAGVAYVLRGLTPFVAAPCAVGVYFAAIWLVGGVDREQLQSVRGAVMRRLGRGSKA